MDLSRTAEGLEAEVVLHLFGWRVRLYAGHSIHYRRQARTWRSDLGNRGAFVVPWGCRAFGIQWARGPYPVNTT